MALPLSDLHSRSAWGSLPRALAMLRTCSATEPQQDPITLMPPSFALWANVAISPRESWSGESAYGKLGVEVKSGRSAVVR